MLVLCCLIDPTGLQIWWTCGGVTPAVGAAIAAKPKDPMSLKLERAGESHSHMLPLQSMC